MHIHIYNIIYIFYIKIISIIHDVVQISDIIQRMYMAVINIRTVRFFNAYDVQQSKKCVYMMYIIIYRITDVFNEVFYAAMYSVYIL